MYIWWIIPDSISSLCLYEHIVHMPTVTCESLNTGLVASRQPLLEVNAESSSAQGAALWVLLQQLDCNYAGAAAPTG